MYKRQSIRSGGEIEDAFLKRLEADRMKGFSRAFEGLHSKAQDQRMWSTMSEPAQVLSENHVNGVPEVAEGRNL